MSANIIQKYIDENIQQHADQPFPVVIVGAGPAGIRVAQTLCRQSPQASIVIYSDEPWEPYNRVRLSSFLAGELDWGTLTQDQRLPESGQIARIHSRVVEIDRERGRVRDQQGYWMAYSHLVLATGSRPHVPSLPGVELGGVYTFRDLNDAERLFARRVRSRHIVVLGGGLLGLEAARAMQRFRTEVTVVHAADRLMNRQLDETGAELLRQQVASLGIQIILNDGVKEVLGDQRVAGVRLRSGYEIPCDTLIIAAGIRPNVELARQAGLAVAAGIRVDDAMRTSDPRIYAVGECIEHGGKVYGLVTPGLEQAAVAAHVIAGDTVRYSGSITATRLKVVGCPVFSMGSIGEDEELRTALRPVFHDPRKEIYCKLAIRHWRLCGAMAVGDWPDMGRVQEAVTQNRRVWPWQLWRFRRSGSLWSEGNQGGVMSWPAATAVCNCTGVTRGQLGEALAAGCRNVEDLAARTGASTVCGSCRPLLAELVGGKAAVRQPERAYRPLLVCAALALVIGLTLLIVPGLVYPETVQLAIPWDRLWRDDTVRQISGFTVLGLSLIGLLLSLRKRWSRLRVGDFALWRYLHAAVGVAIALVLIAHTGARLGDQLNALLMVLFTLLILVGAGAGAVIGSEHRIDVALAQRLRRQSVWLHILLFWPVPVLLAFHVLKFYYF